MDPDISCKVCGLQKFKLREGFYYCEECGTKHDQVRAIEIEHDEEFNQTKKSLKKQKIKVLKTDKPQLTSWECYNYILRGIVEELLDLGAKEELKLMTLQVWAAYLRRTEAAFFNKKHSELPKLGVRFQKIDSETLYNHSKERRKKRQRRRTEDSSIMSGESSIREWRRNKRKLDESEYSLMSKDSLSQNTNNTSSTGTTAHAIQLKFSSLARKQYKKIMPIKHLQKHEKDAESTLECHKMRPKVRSLAHFDYYATCLNMKQLYAIVAIALNLVGDEIQFCDLVRFIDEERICSNVYRYFPENIVPHCKELLKEIGFFSYSQKFNYKLLCDQTSILSRFLNIHEFMKPNIHKLVQRYITDLNIPEYVGVYIDRLINLLPPQMKTRASFAYPAFEARAMAYIVFVMKLFFGLDGHKEKLISESAKKVNAKINQCKDAGDSLQPLFVWSEWVEYIEMRKVIVSQHSRNFCQQFKQSQSIAQLIGEINELQQRQDEEDTAEIQENTSSKETNIKRIFENFEQNYTKTPAEQVEVISFPPSFTPSHSYFKRILLHVSTNENSSIFVPEFMRVDHTQRSIGVYLQHKSLRKFFATHGYSLKVTKAPCSSERKFVGIFRTPLETKLQVTAIQADYNVSEEEWLETIKDEPNVEELEFKTELESYHKKYIKRLEAEALKKKAQIENESNFVTVCSQPKKKRKIEISPVDFLLPPTEFNKRLVNSKQADDIMSLHSIDVFHDGDMEPIENLNLTAPRKRFDGVNLFKDISSDEESENEVEGETQSLPLVATESDLTIKREIQSKENDATTISLVTSSMDIWVLIGYIVSLNEMQKKILEHKFPRSFFWLLQTCAQTIGVDWALVYEQLMVIESMFVYGIEPLDNLQDHIKFKSQIHIKDINHINIMLKDVW